MAANHATRKAKSPLTRYNGSGKRAVSAKQLMDSAAPAAWIEICLDRYGDVIRITARGSRGEQIAPRSLGERQTAPQMLQLASRVEKAAAYSQSLSAELLADVRGLERALLNDKIESMVSQLRAVGNGKLLVRFMVFDSELQTVPWEAACKSDETLGFWASAPDLLPIRGVTSSEPWLPHPIQGAVRIQAIAVDGSDGIALLESALHSRIEAGDIEWLEPIRSIATRPEHLFGRLRRGSIPHVIHFIGHGGVKDGVPVLQFGGESEDEECWIPVDLFAQQLRAICGDALRLVILESCEGARSTAFASAAEILARAGAGAVVAHLWPVKADVARTFSTELYRALTAPNAYAGNIAAAVNEGRRMILSSFGGSAEAFSPVVYLRDMDGIIFDFSERLPAVESVLNANNTPWIHLWRRKRIQDELRFSPPNDGFDDGDNGTRIFGLGSEPLDVFLGRAADLKGHQNHWVLPHRKVSQQCLRITVHEGRTTLERLEQCRAQIIIDSQVLEPCEKRTLHHGQHITIGQVVSGVFVDGRYTQPEVPPGSVDPVTGLLGRAGIAWEMALAARLREPARVVLAQLRGAETHLATVTSRLALAWHAHLPSQPIARFDDTVALLLDAAAQPLEALVALAEQAGQTVVIGHFDVGSVAFVTNLQEAIGLIDKARAKLQCVESSASKSIIVTMNADLASSGSP